jgi:ribosome biogenesis GTPase
MNLRGRIIEGRGGLYTVRDTQGQSYVLRAKNRFRREGIRPLVGDEVLFIPGQLEEHGWLEKVLPRRSVSLRPPVANITQLIITLASEPLPDLMLADKLLVFAFRQDIKALMVVNKSDLDASLSLELQEAYAPAGVQVLALSALEGIGLETLRAAMRGHINCFAGQSGVGKSTLISSLTGLDLETGAVSHRTRRGRQTTRHISLIEHQGLEVLDTPGFSLLELPAQLEPERLREVYPEFIPLQPHCRFEVCMHDQEPGCAVEEALVTGRINGGRVARYRQLLSEQKEKWSNRYD